MSNQKSEKTIDKNLIYIGVFTLAIVIVVIAVLTLRPSGNGNTTNSSANGGANNANAQAATKLSIVSESGNQEETIKKSIKVRKIEFSKTVNEIKKFEAKQEDTLDNPSEANSQDGYTYLSYKFNTEKPATFFGSQVAASDVNSMLTYVFKSDKLIEVRIQYGAVGSTVYDTIVSYNNATYGDATYSRSYNNGTKQTWWKTANTTLDLTMQDGSVIAYYRSNN